MTNNTTAALTDDEREKLIDLVDRLICNPGAVTAKDCIIGDDTRSLQWIARHARALLTSPRAAGLPEGWKLVPIKPTKEMMDAVGGQAGRFTAYIVYTDMLDAAPAAPVAEPMIATPGERAVIDMLLALARATSRALDDSEECAGEDGRFHAIGAPDFDEISDALDALDELPDDKPDYTLDAGGKAEWALRNLGIAQAVAADGAALSGTPFANCQFRICDLPGQCKAEGKCHHPRAAVAPPADKIIQHLEASVLRYRRMVDELKQRLSQVVHSEADAANERAAVSPATATFVTVTMPHKWDETGERCVRCGDKDWMGTTCTTMKPQEPATADERAAKLDDADIDTIAESMPGGLDSFMKQWGWRQFARAVEDEVVLNVARASQAAAPAEAREPLVLWQDGTGMLWDTYSHGKWMHRFVSPHGWDAHAVAQHLYGKGYAGHLEVRAVWSGNYAAPADAGEAVAPGGSLVPTERGIYAWVAEGSSALVLVHTRPTAHSPGGVMNASLLRSCEFYNGCPVDQWSGGTWYGPFKHVDAQGAQGGKGGDRG